ncbi:archease [Tundrisphaera lichenicola]|uniref:archease n=1 Tax=Tundrisphaera lichenicola TaxID=2029860 RepID=UPI003EC0AFD7
MIEVFDHTADVGLRVRGDSLDDLFRTAAEGLFDYVVANRIEVQVRQVEVLTLASDSTTDLLADWLAELIFRSETQHVLFTRFDVRVAADGLSLTAEVGGEAIDRDRHTLDHEVKAVTRHGLSLEFVDGAWVAEMILDI